ncbi:MAG: EamA family transporter [Actinomycetia bacterium]|nr:EamA family transporter [Actinomycetes bacterium]
MHDERRTGWLLAAVGMLLVSTDSFFIRLSEADGVDMAFLVAVFSLPAYFVSNRLLEPISIPAAIRREPKPLAMIGVLAGVSQLSFIVAVTETAVSNVVVIVASTPILAAVIAWIALGEKVSMRVWVAIGATVVGVLIVVSGSIGSPNVKGDLLAVAAIAAFSVSVVVWRRHADASRFAGLALSSTVIVVCTAPFVSPFAAGFRVYACAAAMGLAFNTAGRIAHSTAPRYAPAAEVALFTPVETVAATTWAWIAFGEQPQAATMLGGVVVICGVLYGTVVKQAQPARTG